jgi:hypothetical protein
MTKTGPYNVGHIIWAICKLFSFFLSFLLLLTIISRYIKGSGWLKEGHGESLVFIFIFITKYFTNVNFQSDYVYGHGHPTIPISTLVAV